MGCDDANVDEEVQPEPGAGGDPFPDTSGPADSPNSRPPGHRQEADGYEHHQATAPLRRGGRKEVHFPEELEEVPARILRNVRL